MSLFKKVSPRHVLNYTLHSIFMLFGDVICSPRLYQEPMLFILLTVCLKEYKHILFCVFQYWHLKKLLKSQIFISPQGKTLRRDLYVAFSFVKHLLYVVACSVEELLRGPWSRHQWMVSMRGNFFIFFYRTMGWKGYFGLLEDWIEMSAAAQMEKMPLAKSRSLKTLSKTVSDKVLCLHKRKRGGWTSLKPLSSTTIN